MLVEVKQARLGRRRGTEGGVCGGMKVAGTMLGANWRSRPGEDPAEEQLRALAPTQARGENGDYKGEKLLPKQLKPGCLSPLDLHLL